MNSAERVLTAVSHKEPDRIPFFLLATMHGSKELGISIKEYFSKAEYVVEGQLRMRNKYSHDCLVSFFYGPMDSEAFGGEVIYSDYGPPNSGEPFIKKESDIINLKPPIINDTPCLFKSLKAAEMLKEEAKGEALIIGVVISPFSLPVMQMGFDKYLDLMIEGGPVFERLMNINEEFIVNWANAQLRAGANIIVYFDPVSSPTIIPRDLYLKTGHKIAKSCIAKIKGPTATHFASGRTLSIADDTASTGTLVISGTALEDIALLKQKCKGKISVIGNLNGIEMHRWTPSETEKKVKEAIAKAGQGGGFILSDNHGEIPFQTTDETLAAISDAVHKWGNYPLTWIDNG